MAETYFAELDSPGDDASFEDALSADTEAGGGGGSVWQQLQTAWGLTTTVGPGPVIDPSGAVIVTGDGTELVDGGALLTGTGEAIGAGVADAVNTAETAVLGTTPIWVYGLGIIIILFLVAYIEREAVG